MYLSDDDFVEVETYRRNVSDRRLFITDGADRCTKHCTVRNILYPTVYIQLSLHVPTNTGHRQGHSRYIVRINTIGRNMYILCYGTVNCVV